MSFTVRLIAGSTTGVCHQICHQSDVAATSSSWIIAPASRLAVVDRFSENQCARNLPYARTANSMSINDEYRWSKGTIAVEANSCCEPSDIRRQWKAYHVLHLNPFIRGVARKDNCRTILKTMPGLKMHLAKTWSIVLTRRNRSQTGPRIISLKVPYAISRTAATARSKSSAEL